MKLPRCIMILLLLALLSCCGRDGKNPIASEKTSFTLSGKVLPVSGKGTNGIEVTLKGLDGDLKALSDSLGNYSFPELPPGEYTLTGRKDAWIVAPDTLNITIDRSDVAADDFICAKSTEVKSTSYVCGRVKTSGGEKISGLSIDYIDKDTASAIHQISVGSDGRFSRSIKPGGSYILRPFWQGFEFTISPDSTEIIADRAIVIRNFTARRSTAPLHRISGCIVDRNGNPLVPVSYYSVSAYLSLVGSTSMVRTTADSTGVFSLQARDGVYTLKMASSLYALTPKVISVTISGRDLVLPDIVGLYNGPTYYLLSGKVVDRNGTGIPDARVDAGIPWGSFKTGADGAFQKNIPIQGTNNNDRTTIIFKPRKSGVLFTPDSTIVTFIWKPEIRDGGPVTLPDFIGTDYTGYTAADYFPIHTGASWTYTRTVDADPPAEFVVGVSGTVTTAGFSYYRLSSAWLTECTDFRIEGGTVRTELNNVDAELLRFGALPGTKWSIGKTSGSYPIAGTFIGLEDMTVPSGTYPDCLKYEVLTVYGDTSYETYTIWLAKGVGKVKSVKTLVNYGETKEIITDVLKAYTP